MSDMLKVIEVLAESDTELGGCRLGGCYSRGKKRSWD